MSYSNPKVETLVAAITGDVTDQEMVHYGETHKQFNGAGIEAGGRIELGTATTVDVTVTDSVGRVIYTATEIVASEDIPPVPMGIQGPLLITTDNISNAAHTLSVYWSIRR